MGLNSQLESLFMILKRIENQAKLNLIAFVLEKYNCAKKKGSKKLKAEGRIQDLYHPVATNLLEVNNFVLLGIIKNNWYL